MLSFLITYRRNSIQLETNQECFSNCESFYSESEDDNDYSACSKPLVFSCNTIKHSSVDSCNIIKRLFLLRRVKRLVKQKESGKLSRMLIHRPEYIPLVEMLVGPIVSIGNLKVFLIENYRKNSI
jgi:hypothetical protein